MKATEVQHWSGEYAYWICPRCHGEYIARICDRAAGDGCPYCSGKMTLPGYNDLLTTDPWLAWEWALDNELMPQEVRKSENCEVNWICPRCHREYSAKINEREVGDISCPYCRGDIKRSGCNDLASTDPELAKEWSPNNKRKANNVWKNEDRLVRWICPKCHTEYLAKVRDREVGDNACPVCNGRKYIEPKNTFAVAHPSMAKEWSPNNTLKPEQVEKTQDVEILWICHTCHSEYRASILERVSGRACPYCSGRATLSGYNDLATTDPELAKEWSPHNTLKAKEVRKNQPEYALWICPVCGNEYSARICRRKVGDKACPCRRGKAAIPGRNDLATTNPELVNEWSPRNWLRPTEVKKSQSYSVLWICPKCHGEYRARIDIRHAGDDSCPYCGTHTLTGCNDLATTAPKLAWEWSPNNLLKATEVRQNQKETALWICPKCHKEYSARICDRKAGDRICPNCGTKVLTGYNDVATLAPDLVKEWSPNNAKKPTEVRKNEKSSYLWVCSTCHNEYSMRPVNRTNGKNDCPYCNNRKTLPGYNDLATTDPELAKEWSPNNKMEVTKARKTQDYVAKWICPTCHNEYKAKIRNRKAGDNYCPYCSGRATLSGFNDLTITDPEIAQEWSPNNKLKVTEVRRSQDDVALWICPACHNEYSMEIRYRVKNENACPYCNGTRTLPGYNDLLTTDPELAKEWSPNNKLKATEVRKTQYYNAKWICPTCHNEYTKPICNRVVGGDDCPYCNRRKTLQGYNDLATTDPELAQEWSPNNELKVTEVRREQDYVAKWICPICHHEFTREIRYRVKAEDDCPYCNGRKTIPGFNDLATTDPELAKEWSPNNKMKVTEARKSQSYTVKWICPTCHGEYKAQIRNREVGDNSCPYCNKIKVLPGYNTLKAKRPDMMEEWLDAENILTGIDPDAVMDISGKVAWWQCSECGYKYPMAINEKAKKMRRKMNACPYCRGRRVKLMHYV